MSYGNLEAQIKYHGAKDIKRSPADKSTLFEFNALKWKCPFANRSVMAQELSDGYEMDYCIKAYCILAETEAESPSVVD